MGYSIVLMLHSWGRWAVLLLGIYAVMTAFRGVASQRAWGPGDRRAQLLYTIALDVMVTLGIILYVISPIVRAGLADFGAAMKTSQLRFFMMEHVIMMAAAIAVAHIFGARSKRAATDLARHKTWRTGALASLILVLIGIPWPLFSYGRALFRL